MITVGDVSVKIVTMPGHTPGTLSLLFEFKDKGQPIRAGTSVARRSRSRATAAVYDRYIASTRKFAQAAAGFRSRRAVIKSHHLRQRLFQGEHCAGPWRLVRRPQGTAFSFTWGAGLTITTTASGRMFRIRFVGQRRVLNYMGVVELCAKAGKLRATGGL